MSTDWVAQMGGSLLDPGTATAGGIPLESGTNAEETRNGRDSFIESMGGKTLGKIELKTPVPRWKQRVGRLYQFPAGVLDTTPLGLVLEGSKLLKLGAGRGVGWVMGKLKPDFDHEGWNRAVDKKVFSLLHTPSLSNLENVLSEKTGIPFNDDSTLGRNIRRGGWGLMLGGLPGILELPLMAQAMEKAGIPPFWADLISGFALGSMKGLLKTRSPEKYPSGLTKRKFHTLKKSQKISGSQYERIDQTAKGEVNKLLTETKEKTPIYKRFLNEENLDGEVKERLDKVTEGFKTVPQDTYYDSLLSKKLETRFKEWSRGKKNLDKALNDRERAYRKAMEGLIEEYRGTQEITPEFLLERYRANNETLETAFENTKSRGELKGEHQAVLEANEAIREIITENFPHSELAKEFISTNKQYGDIQKIETLEKRLEQLREPKGLTGKNVNKIKNDEKFGRDAIELMGKEGWEEMEQILHDALVAEKGLRNLVPSFSGPLREEQLAKWMFAPHLSKEFWLIRGVNGIGRWLRAKYLAKPEYRWKIGRGLKALKNREFSVAAKIFQDLEKAVKQEEDSKKTPTRTINGNP